VTDFLLELLSEEIPARMQEKACADLARLFEGELAKAGLTAAGIETHATPRRLALIARALPLATEPVREETKGPRASAPPQALEGFLRKTGLTRDQLVERDGVLFAVVETQGRPTAEVLADAIPAIVRAFPWPKSMRWGAASASTASLRWVRPLKGIVALLGEMVVPFEVDGLPSGATTVGHRFHHPGPITIGSAHDYAEKLRACHVVLDAGERRAIIAEGARAAAEARGLAVVPDEGLVAENAGLTEWPVPLLGDFDPAFLDVPREVIQLTMRTNQKYFACVDGDGRLAPAFICTANIQAHDGGAGIVAGNRKVLAARLADARFFWEQDKKVRLATQAEKLGQIVFHEKLGTVADKVDRVARLARWLVEEGIVGAGSSSRSPAADPVTPARAAVSGGEDARPREMPAAAGMTELADMAEQAARLCKADLVSGMVGEFPELQGVMGGYYARAEGLPDQVADAIRDHYKPVGQGDEVPTAPVTVAVSLADKLDTLGSFFAAGMPPSGSKDPFALRRSSLAIIALIIANSLRFSLERELRLSTMWLRSQGYDLAGFEAATLAFFNDRLKVQQREAGVRHDLIDAVFALGGEDDLVRLLARVKALQAFVGGEEGANLLAGYKRAANILKKEGWTAASPSPLVEEGREEGFGGPVSTPGSAHLSDGTSAGAEPLPLASGDQAPRSSTRGEGYEPAEAALVAALEQAEPAAERAVAEERFADAMAALATLRAPIDAFFDQVTVNDPDPIKRARRLALLGRIRAAVHRVADFSLIEG